MFWNKYEKSQVADAAGIRRSHFADILHRRRGISLHRARLLEAVSEDILGYPIPLLDWLDNRETKHPAFE